MEQPKFKWCRETIAQVRFKPDRDKIWDELIAHIEDRCEELKESGVTEEEAQAKAVAAMGDPVEVGKQLDAVHKPWLGWLWRISRWLLWAVLFGTLIFVILRWDEVLSFYDVNMGWKSNSVYSDVNFTTVEESELRDVHAEGRLGYLSFTVDKVRRSEDGRLMIRYQVRQPWYLPEHWDGELWRLWLTDPSGNRWEYHNLHPDGKLDYDTEYVIWAHDQDGWRSWTYVLAVYGVPEDAPWIDLCYDHAGWTMTIRIDLTGGEGA